MGGLGGNVTVQRKVEPRMTLTRVREESDEPHGISPRSTRMAATAGYASLNQGHDETYSTTKQSGHAVIHAGVPKSYLDKVSTCPHKERPIELHVRPRGGRNFVVELTFTHTWPCDEEHTGHTGITSQTHTGHTGSTSQFNVTHITLLVTCQDMGYWGKGKLGEEGWGGGIEQGGVGTEEEDVPRNMLCQTGICE
ncbi:hypothetical protein Bbelb_018900 [Branchiostoma belcheri]|nr:hypothetical protein Bbelb_018900 [Branchiostoma belcheri]